jgi:16S rRNA (adenine1518-N6/adenine1519-N6)-dimethyltransferase
MANVNATDHVVEIGAGLGSLTLALAETGARITAIEIDHGIAPVLRDVVKDLPNVSVVVGDALELDWNEIIPPGSSAVVVANLPYNVATPLVADLLDAIPQISRFVVMVQKEVALRLASSVGSSDYGAISVKVAYWATARVLGDVPPSVFIPRPKVTSSIIEITRRETPAVGPHIEPQQLFKVIRTGFGQRRKMLRRSLAAIATPENFENAGVSPEARPEELNVEQWGRLATEIQKNHRS